MYISSAPVDGFRVNATPDPDGARPLPKTIVWTITAVPVASIRPGQTAIVTRARGRP